jgi:hypothetical protein
MSMRKVNGYKLRVWTPAEIDKVLRPRAARSFRKHLPIITPIIETGIRLSGLPFHHFTGGLKDRRFTRMRWVIWWAIRRFSGLSYYAVARALHRDHTSIMYGHDTVSDALARQGIVPTWETPDAAIAALLKLDLFQVAPDSKTADRRRKSGRNRHRVKEPKGVSA